MNKKVEATIGFILSVGLLFILYYCSISIDKFLNPPQKIECPEQPIVYNIGMSCDLDWEITDLIPIMQSKAYQLLSLAKLNGLNIKIYETKRGLCRQTQLFKAGTTPKLNSTHIYGEAFDIVFIVNGEKSWSKDNDWVKLGSLGESIGLVWIGKYNKDDLGHFELPKNLSSIPENAIQ